MFGKRIAALGIAAAISVCTCISASADEAKVKLIVSDGYDSITAIDSELYIIDGSVVRVEVIDDKIMTTVVSEDTSAYENTNSDTINADITEGSDTLGYEFTLNIYDGNGIITKTIPIDSDGDITATLSTTTADGGYEYEIVCREASVIDMNDHYALVEVNLDDEAEPMMGYSNTYLQIIDLENGNATILKKTDFYFHDSVNSKHEAFVFVAGVFMDDDRLALQFTLAPTSYRPCILVDASTGEAIGDTYFRLVTDDVDAEIYAAWSYDKENNMPINCRYMDADGNTIATFDNSEIIYPITSFNDNYAAVAQGEAVYLIDQDMNVVSDTFECRNIERIDNEGDGFYLVTTANEDYLVTYSEKTGTSPDTPSEDEPIVNEPAIDEEPTADEPVADTNVDSGDKTSPDTGAAGIAAVTAVSITALGAVVLAKKKK